MGISGASGSAGAEGVAAVSVGGGSSSAASHETSLARRAEGDSISSSTPPVMDLRAVHSDFARY